MLLSSPCLVCVLGTCFYLFVFSVYWFLDCFDLTNWLVLLCVLFGYFGLVSGIPAFAWFALICCLYCLRIGWVFCLVFVRL